MTSSPTHPELSVVIPMYNEEKVLPLLVERLRPVLDGLRSTDGLPTRYEVVAVDDGSRDLTAALLHRFRREWPQLRVVRLRANAGHQAAISAGIRAADGDYVVTLDADLQDPPEVIEAMLAVAKRDQVDVVYGVRADRSTDTWFKRTTASAFYAVQSKLSGMDTAGNAGDFRMMSRATVEAINQIPEHNRVLRFVVPTLGFPSAHVEYKRESRAAGDSKYPLTKMILLSLDSIVSTSQKPLRWATWLGVGGFFAAMLFLVYALIGRLTGHTVTGWASTLAVIALFGGFQLLCLGILGEYLGRMYLFLQDRPTYYIAYDSKTDSDHSPWAQPRGPRADATLPHEDSVEVVDLDRQANAS
ncbi:glycosyltransferase family 2 protein [Arsenicicoccus piscis]|uniref:Glucosyl transferase n=1 Tax=Arsenicicoccus piscis TaxID=673954 RepID=A0ABQ6HKC6_9MICO|nr:glycosyltransferase family 2 protein [Arsenicicoccus piscis]MCH8627214.1 glycosyltransferase family 2 protein [Arsenicicoccus piscis]GMA18811.1 glucosyl transferase [Arsenicicoccus piscis]